MYEGNYTGILYRYRELNELRYEHIFIKLHMTVYRKCGLICKFGKHVCREFITVSYLCCLPVELKQGVCREFKTDLLT